MGTSSKRRGDGQVSQRKSSARSAKERQQAQSNSHSSKTQSLTNDGQGSSRRDHDRDRDLLKSTGANVNPLNVAPSSNSKNSTRRRKILDTMLLGRGMTARYMGVRVAGHMKTLSPSELERDLRHMEAYGTACVSYAQQLFAFSNRELVARGHYGPAPPAPGMTFVPPGSDEANSQGGGANGGSGVVTPHMPVRIDPEEEKRLAILRKKVAASEAKREVLETEYLSLRAHYVHESHKLRRTRSTVNGQLKLLRDLIRKRGKVLAYKRVRCAIARDILACLDHRAKAPVLPSTIADSSMEVDNVTKDGEKDQSMDMQVDGADENEDEEDCGGGMMPPQPTTTKLSNNRGKTNQIPMDLLDVWSLVDSKIADAELACREVPTPDELLYIKSALCADATALEHANEASGSGYGSSSGANGSGTDRHSKSPVRDMSKEQEEEDSGNGSGSNSNSNSTGGKKKSRQDRYSRRGSNSEDASSANSKKSELDTNDNVIPWNCRVMPRTPHGVALYLSNLSSSPELAAAFSCDNIFGSKPQSLAWLEANLPSTLHPGAAKDAEQLAKLQNQVSRLERELQNEITVNSNLQQNIIEGRKKNDELCAMMTMIRTETEAVVVRHNQILETNEAIHAARILEENEDQMNKGETEGVDGADANVGMGNERKNEQDKLTPSSANEEKEEGEVDGDDEGTVVADEDDADNARDFGMTNDTLNKFGDGNYGTSNGEDIKQNVNPSGEQSLLGMFVPGSESGAGPATTGAIGGSNGEHYGVNGGAIKRGYAAANHVHVDPDKKRRKV